MEAEELDRVYETFRDFHAFFSPAFGREQCREHSRHYLQALPVQSQERRNAENLAEMVPVSARALQRFLTEAPWNDVVVVARLQEYFDPPLAVWVFDGSDFPKQGVKSVGVAQQYCGTLGKVANCQAGVFLAHVGPRGRAQGALIRSGAPPNAGERQGSLPAVVVVILEGCGKVLFLEPNRAILYLREPKISIDFRVFQHPARM